MINGLVSIGIFLVIQLVAAVWWAASISTKMGFVLSKLKGSESFSTKEEVSMALITANKELAALSKRIDEIVMTKVRTLK